MPDLHDLAREANRLAALSDDANDEIRAAHWYGRKCAYEHLIRMGRSLSFERAFDPDEFEEVDDVRAV